MLTRRSWWIIGAITALSVVFTAWVVGASLDRGRLAAAPAFDDIVYLVDGARYRCLQDEGWAGVAAQAVELQPHAPLTSALTVLGFLFFGVAEWPPYAAQGVLVLGLLAAVAWLFRAQPLWAALLALAVTVTAPWVAWMVYVLRPDFGCALLTACGVVAVQSRPLATRSARSIAAAAACFAAALLAKPSVFPLTLLLLLVACAAVILRDHGRHPPRPALWRAGALCGLALAFAAPYYAVHGGAVVDYIRMGTWGAGRATGELPLPLGKRLDYYVFGDAGRLMLRGHAVAAALLLSATVVWCSLRRRWAALRHIAAFLAVLVVAWAVPTFNHIKNPFLGGTFHVLVLFGLLAMMRGVLREIGAGHLRPRRGHAVVLLAAVIAVAGFRTPWRDDVDRPGPALRAGMRALFDAVESQRQGERAREFFTSIGTLNHLLFSWWRLAEGKPETAWWPCPLAANAAAYRDRASTADLIIATEPDTAGVAHLPTADLQAELLAWLAASPQFREVERVSSGDGHHYFLFRRRR